MIGEATTREVASDPGCGVPRPYLTALCERRLEPRPEVGALMKRSWLALVATVAAVVILATTAAAVTMTVRDDGDVHRPRPMMGGTVAHDEFSYLTHMVAHHQEAVDGSRQLARSERPQMRAFGRRIVASQSAQIDQMKSWLTDWYPSRATDVAYQPMMRDLSGLSGDQLDRAFLQDMLGHHMAAVMMSQQLLARGSVDHPQVEILARTIRDDQHAEIFQMRRWFTAWFGVACAPRDRPAGRAHAGGMLCG